MLGKIGSYVIALVVISIIELPFSPLTMALSSLLRRFKRISPFVFCILDIAKICVAIIFASWLILKIGQTPSWLMFLIPGYLMVHNNMMRINQVKSGRSNVKRIIGQRGELESYDAVHDLWMKRAHFVGDGIGWIAGTNLVLQSASFF